ncbi:sigma-70 family RNA polymerase sigma factor [Rhizobiales bacterium RZME27]|jgi:RNA polymerase sigma factor (sigma-70 family)|uniref:Sigma-70 family RNA polymerase sigma factor n=1 Tax=Endobacterium cereale TaxID=2663029 RepID=A0A6A8A706_9HYPH|nr:RNA polymerase sigma factor [Endobacterium cereale]MEB2844629.1 RNA polymerase sigma factor [Endobacterium cereale]MQY45056.1 sigma-70 family RNA polymerase sigma factor [Endobacterium cereale]
MHSALTPDLLGTFLSLRKRLLSTISRLVHSHAIAEDLAQDTFVRLWERRATPIDPGHLQNYVLRTGRNLAIDFRRRERIAPFVHGIEHLDFIADHTPSPEDAAIGKQKLLTLSAAIEALPPRARQVFVMARIDGLTYVEIGKKLGISPKTVFSHMVSALEKLDSSCLADSRE